MTQPVQKRKRTAILLAVFFGYWTWLYTYQKNWWKFWLTLGISIVIALMSANRTALPSAIWGVTVWLWAIIDTSTEAKEFYSRYPDG